MMSKQKAKKTQPEKSLRCLTSGKRSWCWKDPPDLNLPPASTTIEDSYLSDESTSELPSKRRKRSKNSTVFITDETESLRNRKPETNEDFERAILGSPNSSILWVQYITYQIGIGEVQKARDVGARALETINHSEESERMNVWKVLINLEIQFGGEEDVKRVFGDAVRVSEPRPLWFALAEDFENAGKIDAAKDTYRDMIKKFPEDPEVHSRFGLFLFEQGNMEAARELLKTCLLRFNKRDQIQITTKFATMEFRHGEPERGRTIFERLVQDNRKRSDIWSVWIDMERVTGNYERVRSLFGRAITQKFSSKIMQFIFNKWTKFEKEFGSEESVEIVKQKAIAYIDSKEQGQ